MAKNFINYEKLEELSEVDSVVPLTNKIIKLSEEVGELSQAYLKYIGSKNFSVSAGNTKAHVLEELCDVMNVSIDILNKMGFDDSEALEMFERKLNKWEEKTKKY